MSDLEELLRGLGMSELPPIGTIGDMAVQSDIGASRGTLAGEEDDSLTIDFDPALVRWYEVQAIRRRKYLEAPKKRKRPGPRKAPYWLRRKRKRDVARRTYEKTTRFNRLGMDLYDRLVLSCKSSGLECGISRGDLRRMVPDYPDRVGLRVERYDKSRGYDEFNLVVRDKRTLEVLWDGAEERLRSLGYIV